jgi:5-methylcytosine-specific restriction endonuclease McrA
MARPRIRAKFFVSPGGEITLKAKPVGAKLRKAIYERDGKVCRFCGTEVRYFNTGFKRLALPHAEIDHIFPRSRGGETTPENLQLLCNTCNSQKGTN